MIHVLLQCFAFIERERERERMIMIKVQIQHYFVTLIDE
jgi:hypothetical protein